MANTEHLAILKQGGEQWNTWRSEHLGARPNLSQADLEKADLSWKMIRPPLVIGMNLSEADLSGANLSGANLSGTDLSGADLSGADLSEANLSGANLTRATLTNADLRWALLNGAHLIFANLFLANLSMAGLEDANFAQARVDGTNFADVDLSAAKGLESIQHDGPSTIGVDTLYKSRGKIPEVFLRGCGLTDWEIEAAKLYDPSLSSAETTDIAYQVAHLRNSQPFQYYSCFISYSTKDQEFADRLYADLQAKGVRCWFAPHDIHGGQKIHEQIDEAIRLHDRLLLILSEHSMSSEWVKTELAKARKREVKEGKRVLFPVRLAPFEALRDWECFDSDTGKDSAREVREYFIPDFSNWKDHDSYQAGLVRLISDLKAGG
jgi:uncharacterized protein YjbI with pentapeptide repeats